MEVAIIIGAVAVVWLVALFILTRYALKILLRLAIFAVLIFLTLAAGTAYWWFSNQDDPVKKPPAKTSPAKTRNVNSR